MSFSDLMVTLKHDADGVKKAMAGFFERCSIEKYSLLEIGTACKKLLARVDEWAVANHVDTDDIMAVFLQTLSLFGQPGKDGKEISGYVSLISMSIERKSYGDEYLLRK